MAGDDLRPFESIREIGRGGAGVVHAVRWQGRDVALKVAQDGADAREQRRFLEEAELLARVSHPAVVEVLGSGSLADGRSYLLMPLIQGETLARLTSPRETQARRRPRPTSIRPPKDRRTAPRQIVQHPHSFLR